MNTYIPAELQEFIDIDMGELEYAPYVLDGQDATKTERDDDDDWHDVVCLIPTGLAAVRIIKYTMDPAGSITVNQIGSSTWT